MNTKYIDALIRKHAAAVIPEFDESRWFALEFNHAGSNVFGVLSHLGSVEYGKYRFLLDIPNRLSYNGDLKVDDEHRGKGLGRKLIELRETICEELGIQKIIINNNENSAFWEHLGYKQVNGLQEFYLKVRFGINFQKDKETPVYKDIN